MGTAKEKTTQTDFTSLQNYQAWLPESWLCCIGYALSTDHEPLRSVSRKYQSCIRKGLLYPFVVIQPESGYMTMFIAFLFLVHSFLGNNGSYWCNVLCSYLNLTLAETRCKLSVCTISITWRAGTSCPLVCVCPLHRTDYINHSLVCFIQVWPRVNTTVPGVPRDTGCRRPSEINPVHSTEPHPWLSFLNYTWQHSCFVL